MWRYNEVLKSSTYKSDCGVLYTVLWPYCGSGIELQVWVPSGPFWELH